MSNELSGAGVTEPPPRVRLPLLQLDRSEAPSFEDVATCVHCGFCLEACPTYRELRVEMDSPRGRIYLMRGVLEGNIAPTPAVLQHLDQCLDCRACETACPSGVKYGHILERTRTVLQPVRQLGPLARLLRWFTFSFLLPSRRAQRAVFKLLWLQQVLGLTALGRWLGRRKLLPRRLAAAAAQAPHLPFQSFRAAHAGAYDADRRALFFPARGERQRRVALFTGCIADQMFADVNQATVEVLTRNGCEVEVVADEVCCGALHIHNGARADAKPLAAANVRAFDPTRYDAIISNAAGCSAELRHYAELLDGDAQAQQFQAKIRDISEYLVEIGWTPPARPAAAHAVAKVAYDDPCHLIHAQKISAAPRAVLAALPGIELVTLNEADACCGSAGLYSVLQPHLAGRVADRKLENIAGSGADVVTTGNPGCLMQIRAGVAARGLPIEVVHPVVLVARAYRAT